MHSSVNIIHEIEIPIKYFLVPPKYQKTFSCVKPHQFTSAFPCDVPKNTVRYILMQPNHVQQQEIQL